MSSLCDCWQAWLVGPVSDPCVCSEEKKQADAWHAYQAYCLRHLGRTGRLGFRKLAATSAQLAPLELPLLRHSVVEVSHRHSNPGELQQTQSMPAATRTRLIPPPSRALPQASSSRERVWSPAGARGAGRTAVTREKSSLVRMQLAAEGKARAPPAAPDEWASSGSSCSYFPAVEGLLSEHTCAAIMPCCEYSTPPPGPVLPTQHRERTESSGGGADSGGAAEAPLHPSISCSRHLNLLGTLAPRPSWPPYRRQS